MSLAGTEPAVTHGAEGTICAINIFSASVFPYGYINIYVFKNLLLASLGLHCCVQVSSNCGKQGLPFVAAHGLLNCSGCSYRGTRALGLWVSVAVAHSLGICGMQAVGRPGFSNYGLQV